MDVALEFERGNGLAAQGKFAEAERCYRRILAVQPQLPEVHCNLGNALMDQGRLDQAVESYRRAMAIFRQRTRGDWAEVVSRVARKMPGA